MTLDLEGRVTEGQRLPREAFLALAAIAWGDGKLEASEIDAITRAAADEELPLDELQSLEATVASPVKLADLDLNAVPRDARPYLYATATWIAALHHGVSEAERVLLEDLRTRLGLTAAECVPIEKAVCDLLVKPFGMRPARFDLRGLRAVVAEALGR